jgi:SAM-dependent methyltransferase
MKRSSVRDNVAVDGITDDGSPVEVYLALPAEPDLGRILSVVPAGASVLDLGSGPGRITNPLVAAGHRVVAVDDSAEMLSHVVGAERVLADIWQLDLGRRFDVVLALSHLINSASRSRRLDLLRVCRRHVVDDGLIVVQRHEPDWVPTEGSSAIGDVGVRPHDIERCDDGAFRAAVTYTVGERSWTQRFTDRVVDDAELATLATANGLVVRRFLDERGSWVVLGAPFV